MQNPRGSFTKTRDNWHKSDFMIYLFCCCIHSKSSLTQKQRSSGHTTSLVKAKLFSRLQVNTSNWKLQNYDFVGNLAPKNTWIPRCPFHHIAIGFANCVQCSQNATTKVSTNKEEITLRQSHPWSLSPVSVSSKQTQTQDKAQDQTERRASLISVSLFFAQN